MDINVLYSLTWTFKYLRVCVTVYFQCHYRPQILAHKKAKTLCANSAQPSVYNIHQNASVDCIHRWNIYSCTADMGFSGVNSRLLPIKSKERSKHVPCFPAPVFLLSQTEFMFSQSRFLTSLWGHLLAKITSGHFTDYSTSGEAMTTFLHILYKTNMKWNFK